jgi:hypothetical protein
MTRLLELTSDNVTKGTYLGSFLLPKFDESSVRYLEALIMTCAQKIKFIAAEDLTN